MSRLEGGKGPSQKHGSFCADDPEGELWPVANIRCVSVGADMISKRHKLLNRRRNSGNKSREHERFHGYISLSSEEGGLSWVIMGTRTLESIYRTVGRICFVKVQGTRCCRAKWTESKLAGGRQKLALAHRNTGAVFSLSAVQTFTSIH